MIKLLRGMFPEAREDEAGAFSRPHGKLDVALGMASRSLHCKDGYKAGDLRLNKNIFSPGSVLTGHAPERDRKRKVFRVKTRSTAQRSSERKGLFLSSCTEDKKSPSMEKNRLPTTWGRMEVKGKLC